MWQCAAFFCFISAKTVGWQKQALGRPLLWALWHYDEHFFHLSGQIVPNCSLNPWYVFLLVQAGDPQEVCTAEEHKVQSSCIWEEGVDKRKGEKTHIQTQKCKSAVDLIFISLVVVLHYEFLHLTPVCDLCSQPIKAPESVATIITSESVFYKVWCLI